MRKIINSTFITLDGAVENPHLWPSLGKEGSEVDFEIQTELLQACDGVLMGRKTYEAFASAWPTRSGDAYSDRINTMPKYVVSSGLKNPPWANTTVITKDVVGEIAALKRQPGKHIVQYGLGPVSFLLMEHGLIDEFRFWLHPLVLGKTAPKTQPFAECASTRLQLTGTRSLTNGMVVLHYQIGAKKSA